MAHLFPQSRHLLAFISHAVLKKLILLQITLTCGTALACEAWYAGNASTELYPTADAACRGYLAGHGVPGYPNASYAYTSGSMCFVKVGSNTLNAYNAGMAGGACVVNPPPAPKPVTPTPSNNQPSNSCTDAGTYAGNPVSPISGEKIQSESDWTGTGAHALSMSRTYRGKWADMIPVSGMGTQWNHEHALRLTVNGDFAVIQFADGSLRRFSRPDATSPWRTDAAADTFSANTTGWLYQRNDDNTRFQFNASGQLISQTQNNGWVRSHTYTGNLLTQVSNHFGRTLSFAYNPAGQLTSVTTPDGQVIQYEYDSSARLSLVRYADNTTKTYAYNLPEFPNALTSITDENNNIYASFSYDSIARAVSTEHAGGVNKYQITYTSSDMAAPVQVADPLGTTRNFSYGYQGSQLAVTSADLPSAGYANAASRVQNPDGTLAAETDYQGTQTVYTWDSTRRLPLITTRAANTPIAQTTTKQWHPTLPLSSKVATPGRITTYVYHGQPDPFNGNALASCAPATALLPDGTPIVVLCKQVEQATTDATGAAGLSAALQSGVPARVSTWTYNQDAQTLTSTDPLNRTSTNAYYTDTTSTHRQGDLQSSSNPLGHTTVYNQYNAAGQLLQSTDPNGVVTTYTYNNRQRLVSTSTGGLTTTHTYTPSGQPLRITQADGSYIQHSYDPAQRLVAVADQLGNTINYTLDNAGNRIAEQIKDPSGALKRQVSRVFDALSRPQTTIGME